MKSNISRAFNNCKKKAPLITYTVAGDNNKINSLKILNLFQNTLIYVSSFVHNCPIADGVKFKIVHIELLKWHHFEGYF